VQIRILGSQLPFFMILQTAEQLYDPLGKRALTDPGG
jgi:hypothetical protein